MSLQVRDGLSHPPLRIGDVRDACDGPVSTSAERMRALRARRAAEIEPTDHPGLRDADELLGPAVEETLAALKLTERDAAAAQLARRYAAAIDAAASPAAALRHLGPLLAKALEALRATPAARPAGKRVPQRRTWLEEMRGARAANDVRRNP